MARFGNRFGEVIRREGREIGDYQRLVDEMGRAGLVLIGEASHGTHEFYETRARITERLIEEKGFNAVVVEADWPDAWRVNRWVRGFNDDEDAEGALGGFKRFPQWMWRNEDVLEFVEWMRRFNDARPRGREKVGFYGMDLYSLYTSVEEVLKYLNKVDLAAARRARWRYSCLGHSGEDAQAYGYAASFELSRSCEDEVVAQLVELRRGAAEYAKRDGRVAEDEYFYAEQNARLIANAERYYRAMFEGGTESWNVRDRHMVETLGALVDYLDGHVGKTKVVVWAHNSHLGDARATDVGERGQLNVGQLVREKWGMDETRLVGFSTHKGTVTAATDWDGPAETKRVRPSLEGSWERAFHDVGGDFLMMLREMKEGREMFLEERLERAIGVIYRPETERISHYFGARIGEQFDAVIHLDETSAVRPLERVAIPAPVEEEETYPTGI
ncbi:MAG TPA: erythromycin esterase family protein [Tepidisphaeraceae bacterium]|jgi:erythromycin esterase-like protein|nr:erythromycin esterase family protein [Tepidisphaeraceae bacterium]